MVRVSVLGEGGEVAPSALAFAWVRVWVPPETIGILIIFQCPLAEGERVVTGKYLILFGFPDACEQTRT